MGQWCPEVKGDKGVERLIWEKFPTMHIWLNKIGQYWSGIWIIRLIFLSISFGSSHWSFYQFQMIFLKFHDLFIRGGIIVQGRSWQVVPHPRCRGDQTAILRRSGDWASPPLQKDDHRLENSLIKSKKIKTVQIKKSLGATSNKHRKLFKKWLWSILLHSWDFPHTTFLIMGKIGLSKRSKGQKVLYYNNTY